MSFPCIGIIVGTTREGRFSERPAAWIHQLASARGDAEYELVDLREHPLPFFDEPMSPASAPPKGAAAASWSRTLERLDGFIVVTAEYNRGAPAVLKNAFDFAYAPWARKPVAFVGHGGTGASRAVEQLRLVSINLRMAPVSSAVHIGMMEFLGIRNQGKSFGDFPHLEQSARQMLDELAWWVKALKSARDRTDR